MSVALPPGTLLLLLMLPLLRPVRFQLPLLLLVVSGIAAPSESVGSSETNSDNGVGFTGNEAVDDKCGSLGSAPEDHQELATDACLDAISAASGLSNMPAVHTFGGRPPRIAFLTEWIGKSFDKLMLYTLETWRRNSAIADGTSRRCPFVHIRFGINNKQSSPISIFSLTTIPSIHPCGRNFSY